MSTILILKTTMMNNGAEVLKRGEVMFRNFTIRI